MNLQQKWLLAYPCFVAILAYGGPADQILLHSEGNFLSQAALLRHYEKHGAGFGAENLEEYLLGIVTFGRLARKGGFPLKIREKVHPWKRTLYQFLEPSTRVFGMFGTPGGVTVTAFRVELGGQQRFSTIEDFWSSIKGDPPRDWPLQADEAVVREWRDFLSDQELCLDTQSLEAVLSRVGVDVFKRNVRVGHKHLNRWLDGQPVDKRFWEILRREYPQIPLVEYREPKRCLDCESLQAVVSRVGGDAFRRNVRASKKDLKLWLSGQPVSEEFQEVLRREYPDLVFIKYQPRQ